LKWNVPEKCLSIGLITYCYNHLLYFLPFSFDTCFVEDTEILTNKEEHFEVIDECMEETKTPDTIQESEAEVITCPKLDDTIQQDPKTSSGKI
jgi:hypothetical protein